MKCSKCLETNTSIPFQKEVSLKNRPTKGLLKLRITRIAYYPHYYQMPVSNFPFSHMLCVLDFQRLKVLKV